MESSTTSVKSAATMEAIAVESTIVSAPIAAIKPTAVIVGVSIEVRIVIRVIIGTVTVVLVVMMMFLGLSSRRTDKHQDAC